LQGASEEKLVLTAHLHRCLILYRQDSWAPILERLVALPAADPGATQWKRILVGYAEVLEIDSAGRILVSPELRRFAGIDRQVMMVGQGNHFEIWSQDAWEKQIDMLAQVTEKVPTGMENFVL
jgi:MraZ protein